MADLILGGAVALVLFAYLLVALVRPRTSEAPQMTLAGWAEIALVLGLVAATAPVLGAYLARVFAGERTILKRVFGPLERGLYALAGVDPAKGQDWRGYALAMLAFNAAGFVLLYAILRLQGALPLNPAGLAGLSEHLAFNTAVSFVTNTNWQSYGGETTMSLFAQMAGLTVQNFLSAATGIALAPGGGARLRAIEHRRSRQLLGGPDALRALRAAADQPRPRARLRGARRAADARRQRDRDDGRGRNADARDGSGRVADGDQASGHERRRVHEREQRAPVREPERLVERPADLGAARDPVLAALRVRPHGRRQAPRPRAVRGHGCHARRRRLGDLRGRERGQPDHGGLGVGPAQGNMEGKEVRFGVDMSALFAAATTGTSTGSVNSMHASYTPLGGLMPLFMIHSAKSCRAAWGPASTA